MVLRNTNIILSGADPEFIGEDINEGLTQILTAGGDLAALVTDLAEERQAQPRRRPGLRPGHRPTSTASS